MSKDAKLIGKRSSCSYPIGRATITAGHSISWIDSLLETPIEDHRKYALWRILTPYLINARQLSKEEALNIIRNWLNKCYQLKRNQRRYNEKRTGIASSAYRMRWNRLNQSQTSPMLQDVLNILSTLVP